ncbi:hypothetical protein G6F31_017863 [Rhizopus arrhizus]|nr:hypothetical protein G6F31_017863 [Rhizopus arrhizus]
MDMQESGPEVPPLHTPAWQALADHRQAMRPVTLRQLFMEDPARGARLTLDAAGWYLDYSKNRVTPETVARLEQLATDCRLPARIDAMFHGDAINASEGRAAWTAAMSGRTCRRPCTAWRRWPSSCAEAPAWAARACPSAM